jgi:hypothetical protein
VTGVARAIGLLVAAFVGGLLAFTVSYATVATQRPDAKAENTTQAEDVQRAGGDPTKVVLVYGRR